MAETEKCELDLACINRHLSVPMSHPRAVSALPTIKSILGSDFVGPKSSLIPTTSTSTPWRTKSCKKRRTVTNLVCSGSMNSLYLFFATLSGGKSTNTMPILILVSQRRKGCPIPETPTTSLFEVNHDAIDKRILWPACR